MPSKMTSGAPVWAAPVCLVLTVIGIGLATYLTIAHYDTNIPLTCPAKGAIDCEAVTTSAQSKVFGIPVALLGLAYFVGMIPWHLPMAWRSADPRIKIGRLLYGLSGIGFVCYLVYAEAFIIKKICLWCTGVHITTLVLFVVTVFASALAIPHDATAIDDDDDDDDDDDLEDSDD
ncbi:MAG TPA: vitamin K epoxide reductase family protein [Acidothermaceae bacterium]